jgi:hypothetical protein
MQTKKHHGSYFLRLMIFGFGAAVGVLAFWFLGYVRDIDRIQGPDYNEMIAAGIPAELQAQREQTAEQINELNRQIAATQQRRQLTAQTTTGSQQTINQLLELKRITSEQQQPLDEEQEQALTENLQLFLTNQRQVQQLNDELITLNNQLEAAGQRQQATEQAIELASEPIRAQYLRLDQRHQWRLAATKLGLLIPLLLVCVGLLIRHAGGTYATLVYALAAAVATRMVLVMHEHFPAIYFRYILILLALAICTGVLIRLLRLLARPSRQWLLRQYREAYATFFCPICEYPIQRGPLKYAYWTRSSMKKFSLKATSLSTSASDSPYTCPSCATALFAPCPQCGGTRHSLLPACEHCGATSDALAEQSSDSQ